MSFKRLINRNPVLKYKALLELWRVGRVQRKLHKNPVTRKLIRLDLDESPENNEAFILPVHETIRGTESVVLPYQLLKPLIEKASGHFILGKCPCRNAEGCQVAPHNFGCLFLGSAVEGVSPRIGTHTDIPGALAHVQKGLSLGLVPMIVHASFDADLLSISYRQMLAVCFCCDCCCTVRHHLRMGPSTFDDTILRLPGLEVTISDACAGCGSCLTACPVGAIEMVDRTAVIDQERCKGCGVCVDLCPEGAPQLQMDASVNVVENLFKRIRSRTDIGI